MEGPYDRYDELGVVGLLWRDDFFVNQPRQMALKYIS